MVNHHPDKLFRIWTNTGGTETFATEALTLEALKALDKAKNLGQPFFLYMSHYAIHIPVNRDKRFYQKYIDAGLSEKRLLTLRL